MNRKTITILTILTILIAFMDILGLPGILIKCNFKDVDPYIIPLMFNFILIGGLAVAVIKIFRIDFYFGFSKKGLAVGLKKYALPGIIAGICSFAAFYIGLQPFNYQPTIWKIFIEGIIYYIGVGIIEEFYVRGLFLNIVEAVCSNRSHKTVTAIIVSSVVFGLGHIPGVISMGVGVIAFKVVSTISMGLYFGMIYKKTNNLWIPIVIHIFINICALPYCFTTNLFYPTISIIVLVITYFLLGIYSVLEMNKIEQ